MAVGRAQPWPRRAPPKISSPALSSTCDGPCCGCICPMRGDELPAAAWRGVRLLLCSHQSECADILRSAQSVREEEEAEGARGAFSLQASSTHTRTSQPTDSVQASESLLDQIVGFADHSRVALLCVKLLPSFLPPSEKLSNRLSLIALSRYTCKPPMRHRHQPHSLPVLLPHPRGP